MKLFAPEGTEGAGGGVAAPPAGNEQGGGDGDFDFRSAAAKVFGNPPPTDRPTTTEKPAKVPPPNSTTRKQTDKPADKSATKEAPKTEVKPDAKAEEPAKRTSLFQKDAPTTAPKTEATAAPDALDELEANVKENDWKAAHSVRDQLKQRVRESEKKLSDYERQIGEYRKLAPDPTEIARLKEEHKAFSDRLALLDYQNHPDFKRQFVEPKQKIIAGVTAILKENGIEDVNVNALMGLPRTDFAKAISALDDRLNSFDAEEVRANMRELQKLNQAERETIAKHGEVSSALRAQAEQKMRSAFEEVQKVESVESWAKPFDLSADAPEERKNYWRAFNEAIPTVRQTAEKYAFALADERTAASVATKAANYDFFTKFAFPEMVRDHEEQLATIKQLTAKLEELNAHRPKTNGDGNIVAGGDQEEEFDVAKAAQRVFNRR